MRPLRLLSIEMFTHLFLLRVCLRVCLLALGTGPVQAAVDENGIRTLDRLVPHLSTAPANHGERVGLHVREKWRTAAIPDGARGAALEGRVVLFVHGGIASSLPAFDLPHPGYSWMIFLADAGFDVFAYDHTGYGRSPRSTMDDPCNLSPSDQARLTPHPRGAPCAPVHAGPLTTRESDWDELESVVDFIRELRGVERVSIVGWSLGGPRGGGFAARHPDKVDRLFLYEPAYSRGGTGDVPRPQVPMRLIDYGAWLDERWLARTRCEDQVDPEILPVIEETLRADDPVASRWGLPEGFLRLRTSHARVEGAIAWDRDGAGRVRAPTMIVTGDVGDTSRRRQLFDDLTGAPRRVFLIMACATHYAPWEVTGHRRLHQASLEWLASGTFGGEATGAFRLDADGALIERME